jgi:hypothetical protein
VETDACLPPACRQAGQTGNSHEFSNHPSWCFAQHAHFIECIFIRIFLQKYTLFRMMYPGYPVFSYFCLRFNFGTLKK